MLNVVEEVEEFSADLHVDPLGDGRIFLEVHVKVGDAAAAHGVTTQVALTASSRHYAGRTLNVHGVACCNQGSNASATDDPADKRLLGLAKGQTVNEAENSTVIAIKSAQAAFVGLTTKRGGGLRKRRNAEAAAKGENLAAVVAEFRPGVGAS